MDHPVSPRSRPSESPEERRKRRRLRRWRRRARVAAPFLGLPLLLATLALSVDLVEIDHQPPPERLEERPLRERLEERPAATKFTRPKAIAKTVPSVLDGGSRFASPDTAADFDLTLDSADDRVDPPRFAPPQPPYALRGRR